MEGIPILKIELEGVKERFAQMVMLRGDEVDKIIQEQIDKTFEEKSFVLNIQVAVDRALNKAVESLAEDYRLQRALKDALLESLEKRISTDKAKVGKG